MSRKFRVTLLTSLKNKSLISTLQEENAVGWSKKMIYLSTFDKWVRQARTTGSFKTVDNLIDEQRELIELRKRNKELEMQVDILKQTAVMMARKGK